MLVIKEVANLSPNINKGYFAIGSSLILSNNSCELYNSWLYCVKATLAIKIYASICSYMIVGLATILLSVLYL